MLLEQCLAAAQTEKDDSSLMVMDMNVAYAAVLAFTTWQRQ